MGGGAGAGVEALATGSEAGATVGAGNVDETEVAALAEAVALSSLGASAFTAKGLEGSAVAGCLEADATGADGGTRSVIVGEEDGPADGELPVFWAA